MIQLPKVKLAFVTLLVSAGFTSNLLPGLTHLSSQIIASPSPSQSPRGTGTSKGRRTPGGTRGPCRNTDQPLTALVPEDVNGETTAKYPVFWFYIPDAAKNINAIEFSVHPDDKKTLYRTSVKLTKTPGVIGIPLPPKPEYALQLNQSYEWRLVVHCDPNNSPGNALEVYGLVTRVQQNPNAWYDQLTNLAKRYLAEPQNPTVKNAWTELLKSVGLEGLAQEPLVSSVISNSLALK